MEMTKLLAEYIKQKNLDVNILSKETDIPILKLLGNSQTPLNANEFLVACQRIGVRPEQLWNERKDKGKREK